MVQLLILYYLSLKTTHGYEIQKFIQLNHMEEWNNIHSGSIYYAMSKLQKEGMIDLVEKVGHHEKSRKIYEITDKGRSHLAQMALQELEKPLGAITAEKFLIYPIVANLSKPIIVSAIEAHISMLQKSLADIRMWSEQKQDKAGEVEKATFKLMESTVENQIEWHRVLSEHIDETCLKSLEISRLIKKVDFSISDDYFEHI
ncbi:PadR family transcriptional regulator [Fusibacter ferrireducens]|uniref:PadR family transcriptional regulator n=1 Tax=Fusibacter ferrireducens TaxID=2785058 RepID=A0ABR9ZT14_9FIRM|nr:PadR family transcriptional regulator [Fusibacter ferrireducens]MBF4693597.1 PadR family transcriptional regulator [Fusibacter ferrireducens]